MSFGCRQNRSQAFSARRSVHSTQSLPMSRPLRRLAHFFLQLFSRARVVVISFSASSRRVSLTPIKRIIKCETAFKKVALEIPTECLGRCRVIIAIADFDLPTFFFTRCCLQTNRLTSFCGAHLLAEIPAGDCL